MSSGAELADDYRELKDGLEENLSDASKQGLKRTEHYSKGIIRTNDSQASGDLLRSHRIVPNDSGGYTLKVGGSSAPHAPLVEMGTGSKYKQYGGETKFGPYKAPSMGPNLIEGIQDWIDTKGISARHVPQSDLSYVIALSIARSGTSRQPFLGPAWFLTKDDIKKEHRRAFRKTVKKSG